MAQSRSPNSSKRSACFSDGAPPVYRDRRDERVHAAAIAVGNPSGRGHQHGDWRSANPAFHHVFAVTNRLGWTGVELNRIHETVIWDYRLSRALVAAFCGAGLALSGAIMQSLLRNPWLNPMCLAFRRVLPPARSPW